jgi:hypothetical protein
MPSKIPDCFNEIVERLRSMPTPEQVKRQQALDIIEAYAPPARRKPKC